MSPERVAIITGERIQTINQRFANNVREIPGIENFEVAGEQGDRIGILRTDCPDYQLNETFRQVLRMFGKSPPKVVIKTRRILEEV